MILFIEEADAIQIADRFSSDKFIFSKPIISPETLKVNPILLKMTEREHKRRHLKKSFEILKGEVIELSGKFEDLVLDLEAVKIDG